jgi:hypothetical protein
VTRDRTVSCLGRVLGFSLVAILVSGGIFLTDVASATSTSKTGVITGTVMECPPDPSWGRVTPNPAMVVLLQHGRAYNSQPIVFPKKDRWSGVFTFRVQPGTYEVVSSYQGAAQTVKAKAGRKYEVSFGIVGCPE